MNPDHVIAFVLADDVREQRNRDAARAHELECALRREWQSPIERHQMQRELALLRRSS